MVNPDVRSLTQHLNRHHLVNLSTISARRLMIEEKKIKGSLFSHTQRGGGTNQQGKKSVCLLLE